MGLRAVQRVVFLGLGAVLGLTCAIDLAHAQEPIDETPESRDFDERWKAAKTHGEAGSESGDRESFERCAEIFIELYNEFETHDRADTLLHNAADCSEFAGMIGQAIQLRTALLDRHPQSDLAERTILALAHSYAAIAYYEDAAQRYEQYAKQYAKNTETPDALRNAYLFRVGLGQTEPALRDLDEYERLYERKHSDKAATIFWSRHEQLESSAQQREHALAYLDRYGRTDMVRSIVAEAVVAQIDWRRSCTEPLLFDSCISIAREGKRKWLPGVSTADQAKVAAARAEQSGKPYKPPKRCGGPGHATVTVHARKHKLAADAQARLGQILRAIRKRDRPEDEAEHNSDFADAWAMAMVYQADARYEEFLRLELPDNLFFFIDEALRDTRVLAEARLYKAQLGRYEDSSRRLRDFFGQKIELSVELQNHYAEVKLTHSPYWTLVAAARLGMLFETFADQVDHAKLPRELRSQQQIEAHCNQLADAAEPIREQMIMVWAYCVERSTEYQVFTESSRLCEARLAELDPWRYPATNELFGESVYAPTRMRTVGPVPESGVPDDH
jgi:hypothetical protein